MARRKRKIATITCATELPTLSRIVELSGLAAEPTTKRDQFRIVNSGRILASELDSMLWSDVVAKLDQAVESGTIPRWSSLATTP